MRRPSEGILRPLIGKERTRARRAVEALQPYDRVVVAKLLGLKTRTVRYILDGRMLPGRRFAQAAIARQII